MSAYVVVEVEITNPEGYAEYRTRSGEIAGKYGGRFLARGGKAERLEGDLEPHRVVIIVFPTMDKAREWYYSSDYQAIVPMRQQNGHTSFLLLAEGL